MILFFFLFFIFVISFDSIEFNRILVIDSLWIIKMREEKKNKHIIMYNILRYRRIIMITIMIN